ncbi:related to HNT3-Member of the third branch of the histidine triad (HIT) superfamily of nucleotide-binding proteins [Zygosaccharomyces bailii ISA1307]|nr:related to HNT3-Member of the third branch of the histidine triad (HIT) superfamily of nucleotide-binding proteins [Zygosaccharomyces bailii ISA1307]
MFWKLALQGYIRKPQDFDEVIFWDDKLVIVKDKFPKAKFHLLLLPRQHELTNKHPAVALTGEVKRELEPYIARAKAYICEQFTANYSFLHDSPFSSPAKGVFNNDTFLQRFTQVGVHSVPSMNNLHVHVISRDFNSPCLKNKKHYLSFTTDFFVLWSSLPLNEVPNEKEIEQLLKKQDLVCVYCLANFKNKFQDLKRHLNREFDTHFAGRCTNI